MGTGLKISIITVCFNSESTIEGTIKSVLSQCYQNIEYIVIDGKSTDNTLSIVGSYKNKIHKIISEKDNGIYDAMNKGVDLSTGDVIGILNSDDFYLTNEVLSEVAELFAKDPDLEVVMGDVDFVEDGDLVSPVRHYRVGNYKPWMLYFGLMAPHPGVFVRRSSYDRIGLYKLGYKIAADFDWLIRLLLVDRARFKIANQTWVRMRTGGASTSGLSSVITSTKEMRRSLKENGLLSSYLMLLCRLPFKLFTQAIGK